MRKDKTSTCSFYLFVNLKPISKYLENLKNLFTEKLNTVFCCVYVRILSKYIITMHLQLLSSIRSKIRFLYICNATKNRQRV